MRPTPDPTPIERPRLRPLEAFPIEREGTLTYCLRDPSGDSEEVLFVTEATMWILARFDGTRDLGDVQAEICRASGEIIPRSTLDELVARLEGASFLDSPSYRERRLRTEEAFRESPSRPAVLAGRSYDDDPVALGRWIDRSIEMGRAAPAGTVRAVVAPHIDLQRGMRVYGSAYRAVLGSRCRRIVILGISHHGGELPYATVAKDFETPVGTCPVDRPFLDRLHEGLPYDPLAGEELHRREHSVEFQTLFLRHLLDSWEERRIVPILCCFPWLPPDSADRLPYPESWRAAFAGRLRALIDEETLVVAGVDFAHVGRRFGDREEGISHRRATVEEADRTMMAAIAAGDAAAFRQGIDTTRDGRRICGYPALHTLLEILPGRRGEAIDYDQSIEESTDSLVSFGAIVLR